MVVSNRTSHAAWRQAQDASEIDANAVDANLHPESIKVTVGKKALFEGQDKTYTKPGMFGTWIKADSLTHFDELTAEALE